MEDQELMLTITIPVKCAYRPGVSGGKSWFKFADTSIDALDDDGNVIGHVFGCIGGAAEISFKPESKLMGAGEWWYVDFRDLWYSVVAARDELGPLPAFVKPEEIEQPEEEEVVEPEPEPEPEEEPEEHLEVDEDGEEVTVWNPNNRIKREPGPICFLEVTTWVGSSVVSWARHFYGKIVSGDYKHEVSYVLDDMHAGWLNEEEKCSIGQDYAGSYHVGDSSQRFFDEDHLIECAKQQWREAFPNSKLLVKGYHGSMEPQEALDGDADLVERNNAYWLPFAELIQGGLDEEEEEDWGISKKWREEFYKTLE